MSRVEFDLIDGIKVGETVHKKTVIRNETAADMIAAVEAAEKLISTPDGYQLVSNPVLVGYLALGQQIISVGDVEGPFGRSRMGLFSGADMELLREKADGINEAAMRRLEGRGRSDPSSE